MLKSVNLPLLKYTIQGDISRGQVSLGDKNENINRKKSNSFQLD